MKKVFYRSLLLVFLTAFAVPVFAQINITIHNFEVGTYGRGSTIAVPVTLTESETDPALTFNTNNDFELYLSDASGNFPAGANPIGTTTGFYATFVNGLIPAGTPAGNGYRVQVRSTSPAVSSNISASFTIVAANGVVADATAGQLDSRFPDVFGYCVSPGEGTFKFFNQSDAGSAATASFYNDFTKTIERNNVAFNTSIDFPVNQINYTFIVKATVGGVIGTKAFTFINNPLNSNLGGEFTSPKCLIGGSALAQYRIDTKSAEAFSLLRNYPGLTYAINWGDGTAIDVIPYNKLRAMDGNIQHTYHSSSCGNKVGTEKNKFGITVAIRHPFCDDRVITGGAAQTVSVILPAENLVQGPKKGCIGVPIEFLNFSTPGQSPNVLTPNCREEGALYRWIVDGVVKAQNIPVEQNFSWTFTTPGPHTVLTQLQNSPSCIVPDKALDITITALPRPDVHIAATTCAGTTVVPDISDVFADNNFPEIPPVYRWIISPNAGVQYATGGPSQLNSSFRFTSAGVYTIRLGIESGCSEILSAPQEIVVNTGPTAVLSADRILCGVGVPRKFDNTVGSQTRATLTGTARATPTTYQWTVTSPNRGRFEFDPAADASSQYPTITFLDEANYVIRVVHTNNCGSANDTQNLTIRNAPIPVTGEPYPPACPDVAIQLNAQLPPAGTFTRVEWVTAGTGTFNDSSLPNAVYTPSIAERDAGIANLTYIIHTNTVGCEDIPSPVNIAIEPVNNITSPTTAGPICTGSAVNYDIVSPVTTSTYTWTVDPQPFATGFADGSGNRITDVLVNTHPNGEDVIVTYHITPTNGDCSGLLHTLEVTVSAQPNPQFNIVGPTTVCGETEVTFTRPNGFLGKFLWNWDDGSQPEENNNASVMHTFLPDPNGNGRDREYRITLTHENACGTLTSAEQIITVKPPAPIARIGNYSRTSECGSFTLTVPNLSEGVDESYVFTLEDFAGNLIQPAVNKPVNDKSDAVFNVVPTVTTDYYINMVATGICGPAPIPNRQRLFVSVSGLSMMDIAEDAVCAGTAVNFLNNSIGTEFTYTIYKDNNPVAYETVNGTAAPLPYTFNEPGTYHVSITAKSGSCGDAAPSDTALNRIRVDAFPQVTFTQAVADCDNLNYQFTATGNIQTPDTYRYEWNFGDGTSSVLTRDPLHTFPRPGVYQVTLTTKNPLNCDDIETLAVAVSPQLAANFTVLPADTIFIPNYHFSFRDASVGGPVSWAWDFDDKDGTPPSILQNPEFTYSVVDTGYHNITLTITDNNGCPKTITKVVKITGTPGQLFVPNAFVPTSASSAVQTFMAKGKGIRTWKMQIYNKWGQLLWQTDKLGADGEPIEGWDGSYRGSPAPQGAYLWQIEATFINGTRWKGMSYRNSTPKRTGVINLIR